MDGSNPTSNAGPGEPVEVLDVPSIEEGRPREGSFSKERNVRAILALGFAGIFAITVLLTFISILMGADWTTLKGLLDVLLPAETALLGSAIGFYFGSEKAGR